MPADNVLLNSTLDVIGCARPGATWFATVFRTERILRVLLYRSCIHASLSKFNDVKFVLVLFSLLFLGFCTVMCLMCWPGSESCVYYVLFDRELTRAGGAWRRESLPCRFHCSLVRYSPVSNFMWWLLFRRTVWMLWMSVVVVCTVCRKPHVLIVFNEF